jgi:hypothetical protein
VKIRRLYIGFVTAYLKRVNRSPEFTDPNSGVRVKELCGTP